MKKKFGDPIAGGNVAQPHPQYFADIPRQDWSLLKQRISAAKGRVILLVHPFFVEVPAMARHLEGVLTQAKTPVVILEDYQNVWATRKRLSQLEAPTHLMLPTGRSSPALRNSEHGGVIDYDNRQEQLAKRLKKCGAKTVLIGGIYALARDRIGLWKMAEEALDRLLPVLYAKRRMPFKVDGKTSLVELALQSSAYARLLKEVPELQDYENWKVVHAQEMARERNNERKRLMSSDKSLRELPSLESGHSISDGCAGYIYANLVNSPHLQGVRIALLPAVLHNEKQPYFYAVRRRQVNLALKLTGPADHEIPADARKPFKPNH